MEKTLKDSVKNFTDGKNVIAIVCDQWGDTGKGKFIHLLASEWAKIVIRGTGGANAGHTLIYNGKQFICHLLPSGILNPDVMNVIGRGVALDLSALTREMDQCEGLNFANLRVSHEACLLMPYHILEDLISPKSKLIGTTGCGIGPFYSDYYSRLYITMNNLLNKDIFLDKMNKFMDTKQEMFDSLDKVLVKELMFGEKYGRKFLNGLFYDEKTVFNRKKIADYYLDYLLPKFDSHVIDLGKFTENALLEKKKILLEGAQGTLLSIDHGTTFYQTSSDCTIEGLAKGCGLKVSDVDLTLGIVKAPYMTRVGNGPFPTEFGGKKSEEYCADSKNNAQSEKAKGIIIDEAINNFADEFTQGIAARIKGGEYGATTGRARRTGWLDLIALKHAIKINGPHLILTKLDIMSNVEAIKLCIGYKYVGENVYYGDILLKNGTKIFEFIRDSEILSKCVPIYREFPGWKGNIAEARLVSELPRKLINILRFIEMFTGGKIDILSVGPGSEQTIFVKDIFINHIFAE